MEELLKYGDLNVIIVDWTNGSQPPYPQTAANARVVGAQIAYLIRSLQETTGVSPTTFHIIGFSIGAHVAGYAGRRVKNLGRITALGPGAPYFENTSTEVRLDPADADFVDAIYTDSGGLVMKELVGHANFFVNGGGPQLGCPTSETQEERGVALLTALLCNHLRALDYFLETINPSNCTSVAYACSDWSAFTRGECADCEPSSRRCAIMGLRAAEWKNAFVNSTKPTIFYVRTNMRSPFCVHHFQVQVHLNDLGQRVEAKGRLHATLYGSRGLINTTLSPSAESFVAQKTKRYLVLSTVDISPVQQVDTWWTTHLVGNETEPIISIRNIQIIPMSIAKKTSQREKSRSLCITDEASSRHKLTLLAAKECERN